MRGEALRQRTLLEHLRHTALNRVELVRRTGWTDHQVQTTLDTMVAEGLVFRWSRASSLAEYKLSAAGAARLPPVHTPAKPARAVAKSKRRPSWVPRPQPSQPPDPAKLPLTDADRSLCSATLAQQFDAGLIRESELKRRSYLLYSARTRADLTAVFEDLTPPDLDAPRPEPEPVEWRPDRHLYWKVAKQLFFVLVFVAGLVASRAALYIWLIFAVVLVGNLVLAYRAWRKGGRKQ